MASTKTKEEANPTDPKLWKDIWWTKYVTTVAIYCIGYYCLKLLQKIFRVLKVTLFKPQREEYVCVSCEDFSAFLKASMEKEAKSAKTPQNQRGEGTSEFHEVSDHGIQFYNSNQKDRGRRRRQRMHSTVTESSLTSSGKKRRSLAPNIGSPPFPKLDGRPIPGPPFPHITNEEVYSSGEAIPAYRGTPKSPSQLSPVPEEDDDFPENESVNGIRTMEHRTDPSSVHKLEKMESGINTEPVVTMKTPHLILHQYPRSATGPQVAPALYFENYLRRFNISFTVVLDCDVSTAPWIDDDGKRIEGLPNCMKYTQEKFPDMDFIFENLIDFPSDFTIAPYYPLTVGEPGSHKASEDLYCSGCSESEINICDTCQNYSTILMPGESDKTTKNASMEDGDEKEDQYIDENFEDMEKIVGQGSEI